MRRASAVRPKEDAVLPLALLGLGLWELVLILVTAAVLFGLPVAAMAVVLRFTRRRRGPEPRGKA